MVNISSGKETPNISQLRREGIILCMGSVKARRRHVATSSFTGCTLTELSLMKENAVSAVRGVNWASIDTKYWVVASAIPKLACLTHWGRDKMAAIFQTTFPNAVSWMKMYDFGLILHCFFFLMVRLTISQRTFRKWHGAVQTRSHNLKQWWLLFFAETIMRKKSNGKL